MNKASDKEFNLDLFYQGLRFIRLFSKGVFNRLDKELDPEIFIQLYHYDGDIEYTTIPKSSLVDEINGQLETIKSMMPNKIKDFSGLESNRLNLNSITHALVAKSKMFDDRHIITTDFHVVDQYMISIITSIDKEVLESYYSLKSPKNDAPTSLIGAAISEYINDLNKLVYNFQRNDLYKGIDFNETIRRASKSLLRLLGHTSIVNSTYNKLNKISALNYEGNAIKGKILFTAPQNLLQNNLHENIDLIMEFNAKIPLSNFRHVRKLIEITKEDLYLISDTDSIVGIGKIKGTYDYNKEDLFIIEFVNYHTWELRHMDHKLMDVNHDRASLPKESVTYSDFKASILRLFMDMDLDRVKKLYKLIVAATKQDKGALIVISPNARSEAKRLKSQCFLVAPKELKPSMIKPITSIDGAILMDTDGFCHGLGAILDGMATTKGDTSRGARYNSAIRYVETISKLEDYSDCLAIVISEDKMVDIITRFTI